MVIFLNLLLKLYNPCTFQNTFLPILTEKKKKKKKVNFGTSKTPYLLFFGIIIQKK